MRLLAIDTTSDACSVALRCGETVLEQHVVEPRQHSKILLPMITSLLREAGLAPTDLDAVVLGNGPGSFIGLRIGAAVAQGICYGAGLGIVPVSSLAAVAAEALEAHDAAQVVVAQDARLQEVYIGIYGRDAADLPCPLAREDIRPVGQLAGLSEPHLAAGGAWRKYPALWSANAAWLSADAAICVPRARYLLGIGSASFAAGGAIPPAALEPAYIRVKVADLPSAAGRREQVG
jgi:tRNA threonylcarbamoyladenosine biosynthesis protein TsaB